MAGGTGLAAVISAAALPVLTRLYAPEDFGTLAVFMAIVQTISVAACLRLDIAVPIPERNDEATNVLALAMLSAFGAFLLTGIGVAILAPHVAYVYLWLTPFGVLFAGLYLALTGWAIRTKSFSLVARTRVAQSIAAVTTQIVLAAAGPVGLLIGATANHLVGAVALAPRKILSGATWQGMRSAFRAYRRFPQYSALEALANMAAIQLPLILIAAISGAEAGHLLLALTIIQAPMTLLGSAVGQAYLSQAPEEHRAGRLDRFTRSIVGGLFKTGAPVLILGGLLAPVLFPLVFGEEWARAGILMAWMTPWFVLQFIASPVSMVLHVTNNQRAALLLQIAGFVLRIGSIYVGNLFAMPSEVYALSGAVFYGVYLLVVFWSLRPVPH